MLSNWGKKNFNGVKLNYIRECLYIINTLNLDKTSCNYLYFILLNSSISLSFDFKIRLWIDWFSIKRFFFLIFHVLFLTNNIILVLIFFPFFSISPLYCFLNRFWDFYVGRNKMDLMIFITLSIIFLSILYGL